MARSTEVKVNDWERPAVFVVGVVFILLLLVLAIFFPNPTDFQYFIFRTVIALAAAGVAALIPGLLQIKIPAVQAGGALAVLVLVYEFSPASLVSLPPSVPKPAAVSSQTSAPEQTYKVCMGNGGGDSCRSGADASFDCDHYKGIGGGGPQTYKTLGEQFCTITDNGQRKQRQYDIKVYQNNGGGQCGWTGFLVSCHAYP